MLMQRTGIDFAVDGASVSPESAVSISVTKLENTNARWDEFVRGTGGDLVQTSMWGLTKIGSGEALLLEGRDPDGNLIGGALIVVRTAALKVRVGYVARGPVFSQTSSQRVDDFLSAMVAIARERHLSALIVQPPNAAVERALCLRGFAYGAPAVAPEATIYLDPRADDASLLNAMTSSRRHNVRKSSREGIDIAESDDIQTFHHLLRLGSSRVGYEPPSPAYLESQWKALYPFGAIHLLMAFHQGRPIAAKWLTKFGGVVTSRLTGWDAAAGKRLHANEALHWAAINWARREGAARYDFGGFDRSLAETVLAGEAVPEEFQGTQHSFKLDFGAKPELYPRAQFILPNRTANFLLTPIASHLLRSNLASRLAKRLRNN